jgi:hypothetical protein
MIGSVSYRDGVEGKSVTRTFLRIFPLCAFICLAGRNVYSQDTPITGASSEAHGCLGPAGYVWCPVSESCIRSWEQPCYQSDNDQLRFLLALTYGKRDIDDIELFIEQASEMRCSGRFKFWQEGMQVTKFFVAAKINSFWVIEYSGNTEPKK